jgi:hypothetical protein
MSSRAALTATTAKKQTTKLVKPSVTEGAKVLQASNIKRSESTTSVSSDTSKTRRHLTSVLDINISQARCHRHLKMNLSNSEAAQEIKTLRESLKDNTNVAKVAEINGQIKELTKKQRETKNPAEKAKYQTQINGLVKTLKDTPALQKVVETTKKIDDLTQTMVRLSSEVSVVVATVCDFIVDDIVSFAMDFVIANGKRQVQPFHLVEAGIEKTKSYPFIRNLPVYLQQKEDSTKVASTEPTPETTDETSDEETTEETDVNSNNFVTYVTNAIGKLKKTDKYGSVKIRISKAVRKYLSNLIIDFIKRISNYSQIIVQDISDVRTLNPDHVVNIIKLILTDEGSDKAVFGEIRDRVNDKLGLYKVHCSTMKSIDENTTA